MNTEHAGGARLDIAAASAEQSRAMIKIHSFSSPKRLECMKSVAIPRTFFSLLVIFLFFCELLHAV